MKVFFFSLGEKHIELLCDGEKGENQPIKLKKKMSKREK